MLNKHRPQRIVVFGHFGAGNFGNESTLQAMLYNLRQVNPEAEITCVCTVPERVAADYQIAARPISETAISGWRWHNPVAKLIRKLLIGVPNEVHRWFKAFTMLRHTDAFVVPGTGLLTDAYSLVGWGPYNTFKWSVIAKLCRCKLLFVSVGAGPLYSWRGKFFIKTALALADFRSYRDVSTQTYLETIGVSTTNDNVYPDLAFSLPESRLRPAAGQPGRRRIVGIGLMEYAGRYSVSHPMEETYTAYIDSLADFTAWLLSRDYDVRLLIGDVTDRAVVQHFKSVLQTRLTGYDAGRISDDTVTSVDDLLAQLASTDFVVATRFHNILLALLLNKPVVSISFHHKCASLMKQMDLSSCCLDINTLTAAALIEHFSMLERNIEQLRHASQRHTAICRDALDQQYRTLATAIGAV